MVVDILIMNLLKIKCLTFVFLLDYDLTGALFQYRTMLHENLNEQELNNFKQRLKGLIEVNQAYLRTFASEL